MSLLAAGQFQVNQAQTGLGAAAERETQRNVANRNLKEQNDAGKASIGATVASTAGGLAGSAIAGAQFGAAAGPYGAAAGAVLGAIAGAFGSKLF